MACKLVLEVRTHNVLVPHQAREPRGDHRRAALHRDTQGCENAVDVRDENIARKAVSVLRADVGPCCGRGVSLGLDSRR